MGKIAPDSVSGSARVIAPELVQILDSLGFRYSNRCRQVARNEYLGLPSSVQEAELVRYDGTLRYVCLRVEDWTGIPCNQLRDMAENSAFRSAEAREILPKLRELDRDGSTAKLLSELVKEDPQTVADCGWVVEQIAPVEAVAGRAERATPTKSNRKASVNARMMETIQANSDAMGWNSPKWAKELCCAKSAVVETKTWKDLTMRRDRERAERANDRRRRPKASDGKRG